MHMAYLSEALLHEFGRKQFHLYCICDQTSWICFTLLIFLGAFLPVGWYFFYLWGDLRHYMWGDIFLPVGWLPQQDPRRGADLNATKKDILISLFNSRASLSWSLIMSSPSSGSSGNSAFSASSAVCHHPLQHLNGEELDALAWLLLKLGEALQRWLSWWWQGGGGRTMMPILRQWLGWAKMSPCIVSVGLWI